MMTPARSNVLRLAALSTALAVVSGCETLPSEGDVAPAAPIAAASADLRTGAGRSYPPTTSSETPEIRFGPMVGVSSPQRQFFVDQINLAAASGPRLVPVVAQAVGDDKSTLLFMSLSSEQTPTPYLARAMLARMTSILRFAPAITEMGLSNEFDIYNMAAVLGFERIVVSDGRTFSHEALLIANP